VHLEYIDILISVWRLSSPYGPGTLSRRTTWRPAPSGEKSGLSLCLGAWVWGCLKFEHGGPIDPLIAVPRETSLPSRGMHLLLTA